MFTVAHECNGTTVYYESKKVRRTGPFSLGAQGLWIDAPSDPIVEDKLLQGGTAYIMNESGATIAKWELPEDNTRAAGVISGGAVGMGANNYASASASAQRL